MQGNFKCLICMLVQMKFIGNQTIVATDVLAQETIRSLLPFLHYPIKGEFEHAINRYSSLHYLVAVPPHLLPQLAVTQLIISCLGS